MNLFSFMLGAWRLGNEASLLGFGLAFALCAMATGLLSLCAFRLRLVDRVGPDELGRKEAAQSARTPVIGGIALAVSLLASSLLVSLIGDATGIGGVRGNASGFAIAACLGAFFLGLVDDTRKGGISAGTKLALQAIVALLLALATPQSLSWAGSFALTLRMVFAIGALNIWNTWDHADGNAAGTGLLAFLLPAPPIAGACAGFLLFNLGPARRRPILGDAGSHLLAALCVLTPASWPLMILPALDLARVCWLRLRAGSAPWQGDRRHLAHRLQRRGLSRHAIFLLLGGASALSLFGPFGWGLTLLGFSALVAWGDELRGSINRTLPGSPRAVAERAPIAPPREPGPPAAPAPAQPEPLRAQ